MLTCRPQISEWIIATYLAFNHKREFADWADWADWADCAVGAC